MLRVLAGLGLTAMSLMLSGCYLGPGYSYVRQTGYQGGAYYGQSQVYGSSYYPGYAYGPYGGYGYGYGCCYAPGVSVGVGAIWYDRPRYRGHVPPPRYRPRFDGRPRAGNGWRGGPGRGAPAVRHDPGRGAAGPGRSGAPRGAAGPHRGEGHRAAGHRRQRNIP